MGTTWEEQYVDRALERTWLALRLDLADQLAAGIAGAEELSLTFESLDGEVLDVDVFDEVVVIGHGEGPEVFDSVDEAAYRVYEILHDEWALIDPAFLVTEVAKAPTERAASGPVDVPSLGKAESREELQAWVQTALQAHVDGATLSVSANGDLPWCDANGARVVVSVRNQHFVEVWAVLAERVGFAKAHKVIDQLSRRHPAVRFHLDQDTLIMSRVLDASPFVPEHLIDALSMHLSLAGELGWVREKLLRRRARIEQETTVPTALAALLPTAYRVSMVRLVAVVADASGDPKTLAAWLEVAKRERQAARDLPRGDDDTHRVGRRARWAWLRLERALIHATTTPTEGGHR